MIPLPLLVVAILAAGFAAFSFLAKRAVYRRWHRTEGEVIELIQRDGHDSGTATFLPRISFRTASGETSEFVPSSSSFPAPAIGEKVPVRYDPGSPMDATIDRFGSRHLAEVIVFAAGMTVVVIYMFQRAAR